MTTGDQWLKDLDRILGQRRDRIEKDPEGEERRYQEWLRAKLNEPAKLFLVPKVSN
jgi:hypothetical protein